MGAVEGRRAQSSGGARLEELPGDRNGLNTPTSTHMCPGEPHALGGWSTSEVLRRMFLKSVSGNSLGLGFSHVYMEAGVILCQPQGAEIKVTLELYKPSSRLLAASPDLAPFLTRLLLL